METWVKCRGTNVYEVSDTGKVRNRRTGKLMKSHINDKGYETIQLSIDGKPKSCRVHRLVAEAFNEGNHDGLDVNHIDGNKLNNNINNLEFCTRQENIIHAHRIGLNYSHKKKKVHIIETGQVFDSVTECADYLGVTRHAVSKCINGSVKCCRGYHIYVI